MWLVRNLDIDGIYLDGASYERTVLRRLRAALEPLTAARSTPFLLDLHASCFGNPHLPYAELYPYIDSVWYGEQCNYAAYSPDQWLAEVSGVPFGLPGQVLGDNHDQWRALVFGMTCRIYPDPHRCNPRPLWAVLDSWGLDAPRMLGWWDVASPITVTLATGRSGTPPVDADAVRATLFVGASGAFAVALASWSPEALAVTLAFDWDALEALGMRGARSARSAKLTAPAIDGFQPRGTWVAGEQLTMRGKGSGFNEGWLIRLHAA